METVATRSDLHALELTLTARIAEAKAEVMRWMFGAIGLQTLAILGGMIAILGLGTS